MPAKWVLITGVSEHGMGDALATELRSKGINVIATGPTTSQLDYLDTSTPLEGNIEKLQLDVTSPSSISAAVEATDRITHGQLHYLVNNAGYGYMMPLLDVDVDKMKKNFEVNVFGVVAVTQAFFPLLRAAEGMVVNQASIGTIFLGKSLPVSEKSANPFCL
jgi:short-subunit dehydrogenase